MRPLLKVFPSTSGGCRRHDGDAGVDGALQEAAAAAREGGERVEVEVAVTVEVEGEEEEEEEEAPPEVILVFKVEVKIKVWFDHQCLMCFERFASSVQHALHHSIIAPFLVQVN